ncbi:unnamed protein product, partial [Musa acuminata var. zebrina]
MAFMTMIATRPEQWDLYQVKLSHWVKDLKSFMSMTFLSLSSVYLVKSQRIYMILLVRLHSVVDSNEHRLNKVGELF